MQLAVGISAHGRGAAKWFAKDLALPPHYPGYPQNSNNCTMSARFVLLRRAGHPERSQDTFVVQTGAQARNANRRSALGPPAGHDDLLVTQRVCR
jgi:hypothetical protein